MVAIYAGDSPENIRKKNEKAAQDFKNYHYDKNLWNGLNAGSAAVGGLLSLWNPAIGIGWNATVGNIIREQGDQAKRTGQAAENARTGADDDWGPGHYLKRTTPAVVPENKPPEFSPGSGGQALTYNPGASGFGMNNFGGQSAFGGYDPYGGRYVPTERMFTQLESARMQGYGQPTAFGMR